LIASAKVIHLAVGCNDIALGSNPKWFYVSF